jgi:hypothetical protein
MTQAELHEYGDHAEISQSRYNKLHPGAARERSSLKRQDMAKRHREDGAIKFVQCAASPCPDFACLLPCHGRSGHGDLMGQAVSFEA